MSSFVLVHGAWHGAWCWDAVVPLLAARGHRVRAIDLPGHGADPKPPGAVSWDDYMGRMGEVIAASPEPPILVGHSLGGAVITGAADRWPERIRALVYLCAMLPDSSDFMARFQASSVLTSAMRPSADGSVMELEPSILRAASEAEALSHESEALAGDDLKAAIAWRGVRAEALARRGETQAAIDLARRAVEIAAATDALLDHADARQALAAALRAAGRAAEAEAEERRAIELWEAKGATLLAERARGAGGSAQTERPHSAAGERAATALRRVRPNAVTASCRSRPR